MKKLYLLLLISANLLVNAQGTSTVSVFNVKDIDNGLATVVNNQVFNKVTTPNGLEFPLHLKITNVSASTVTFVVRKFDNTLNAVGGTTAASYFCFDGACFLPGTNSSTIAVPSGSVANSFSLIPKLDEASSVGLSNVSYEISDITNGSDLLVIEIRYNAPASVKENANLFSASSVLYPNPSSSKSFFDVIAAQEINSASLKLYNSLGSVISSKALNLNKGKNTLTIDSDNLQSGIYFVSLTGGNSKIVKKLTITN